VELDSCHRSGAQTFEIAVRFLENLWTPDEVDKIVTYGENFTSLLLLPQKIQLKTIREELANPNSSCSSHWQTLHCWTICIIHLEGYF